MANRHEYFKIYVFVLIFIVCGSGMARPMSDSGNILASIQKHYKGNPDRIQYKYESKMASIDKNGESIPSTIVIAKGIYRKDRALEEFRSDVYRVTSDGNVLDMRMQSVWTGDRLFFGNDNSPVNKKSYGSTSAFRLGHYASGKGRIEFPGFQADGYIVTGEHFIDSLKHSSDISASELNDPELGVVQYIKANVQDVGYLELWLGVENADMKKGKLTFAADGMLWDPETAAHIIETRILNNVQIEGTMIPTKFVVDQNVKRNNK